MISGFLIYRPYVAAQLAARKPLRARAFFWRRLLRLVPAYWAALTFFWWLGNFDLGHDWWVEDAGCHVIQEEERLRPRRQHVVHAVVDEVRANLAVTARAGRQQDLGADTVGARHQDGLPVTMSVEREQAAEGAHAGEHFGALGRCRQRLDQLDRPVARLDVDAGIAVSRHRATVSSANLSISSCTGTGTG